MPDPLPPAESFVTDNTTAAAGDVRLRQALSHIDALIAEIRTLRQGIRKVPIAGKIDASGRPSDPGNR